ncbi:MAG: GGDEF domain-containing protein, partial [Clostridia bacterium]|nr:GGDEF domain-containing protein [Clostridia bacterium]
ALIFAFVFGYIIRRNVTGPIFLLEKSARKYAQSSVADGDAVYEAPNIKADNEVKSLGDAIKYMADSLKVKIEENFLAGRRAEDAEKENARLVEKAAAADKIARLSQSVNALLDNMPAMTFYKDIETGKYIACNQAFAKNCNKSCPEEVTGLTDHDIYDKDTADHFVAFDKKAIESEGPISYFEDVSDACGRRHQYQTTKLIFTDPTGTPRLLGMCVEVTELLEMKSEKEKTEQAYKKAKDMSLTYSRIANALSLDYIFLYYIDVVTEEFIEYRSGAKGEDLAIARRGTEFFTVARKDAQDVIHKDDLQIFLSTFTKRNVLDKINALGTFTSTYRLFVDGRYAHVNMKASKLGGEDDHIIIGVSNVDAQMKDQEELERIYQESITYSRIAALSGNYIGIYTVDPETDDYIEYSATHEYEGLGLEKQGKNFFEVSVREGKRVIYFEDKEHFSSVFKKENILKEIRENGLFVVDYRLMINGVPNYVTLKAAIVEEKDGPQLIIGILNVDAQVRREQEYVRNLVAARNQADVDALTGVKNKHAYIDVEALINRNIDENADVSFAIVICDVNRLKEVNDTKGHVAGDEYIRSGCRMICEVFEHSPVFRVGGDEFVVIAQGADYDNIDALIEKLNARNKENAQKGEVVVACGMAKFDGDRNVSAVLERADILMYENKKNLKR